jgi:SAM-dependent methyltransferase
VLAVWHRKGLTMTEPIGDVAYWRGRLEQAQAQHRRDLLHTAVFRCPLPRWKAIEAKHRQILERHIGPDDSILDAGCGWGRLLGMLPDAWQGVYVGVDLSPDFIAIALQEMSTPPLPGRKRLVGAFMVGDLTSDATVKALAAYPTRLHKFHWAVLISIRPMVKRNQGDAVWATMEANIRQVADRLLYLEYDPDCDGFVE